MRGHYTNGSVSRTQPCDGCAQPKGSIWTGAYDPKTKVEMASIAHPESYYQGASYCSLRLLADVPFASCTSCHVVAGLRGRIRRQGATCTPKTRAFPTPVLHSIHDAYRWRLISSLLVCFSTSRNLETPLRCDRLNVARPFRSVGWGKDRSNHTTVESLTLPAAPTVQTPPSRARPSGKLIETPYKFGIGSGRPTPERCFYRVVFDLIETPYRNTL